MRQTYSVDKKCNLRCGPTKHRQGHCPSKKKKKRIGANRYLKGFYKRNITIYISLLILKRRFFRQSSPQHSQCFEFHHNYQRRTSYWPDDVPVNILCKSIEGRYRSHRFENVLFVPSFENVHVPFSLPKYSWIGKNCLRFHGLKRYEYLIIPLNKK